MSPFCRRHLAGAVLLALSVLRKDRRGVTAIEYALLASLIAVGCGVGLREIGVKLTALYERVSSSLSAPSDYTPPTGP